MVADATAGGTLLADGIGWGNTLNARRVRMLILLLLAFGAVVTAVASTPPVELIVAAQAMTVLVAPLLGVLLVILANNRRLMGDMRNPAWQNIVSALGLMAIAAGCYSLLTNLLKPTRWWVVPVDVGQTTDPFRRARTSAHRGDEMMRPLAGTFDSGVGSPLANRGARAAAGTDVGLA